jgi:hypothetical protein
MQVPCVPPACTPPVVVTPPTPEQMAPMAPQVTYQNGQLSILAQNSTLGSILSAVRARTGAHIDVPPDAANDRVAAQLGPGNPRDILASLLEGSRFDYIVLGSPTNPDALSQVILTPHAGSGGATATASMPQPGGNVQPGMPPRPAGGAGRPEMTGDEEEGAEVQTQPEPQEQPQPVVAQPAMPNPGAAPQAPGQQQNPNQVKTPEQLLLELQRMQQQQQGQQQPPRPRGQQQQQ